MVLSKFTLVNRLFISKEIILYPAGIVSSLSLLIRSFVFKIFKYIQEKYGREMIKLARKIEKQYVKIAKVKYNIRFMLYCKKNIPAPVFARPKFPITVSN